MDFNDALIQLSNGQNIARPHWGADFFIKPQIPHNNHTFMRWNVKAEIARPWGASMLDKDATDWVVV